MHARVLLVGVCVAAGCAADVSRGEGDGIDPPIDDGSGSGSGSGSGDQPVTLKLPPANAKFDYQLGGAYSPPVGVEIVSRDHGDIPATGDYNICYINGFQIQPDEASRWLADYPDLILRDSQGNPVIDVDWNEMLIDISTPAKRAAVAAIVDPWILGCKQAGFDAVEIDNLDTYSRSGGRLTQDNAVAMMRLFSDAAHSRGLAASQKNSAELVGRKAELGSDFVIAEECNHYGECDVYTAAYGDLVIVIEYTQADFDVGCAAWPGLSIVLRDRNLVTPSQSGYRFAGC